MKDQPSANVQAAGATIGALVGTAIAGPSGSVIGAAVTPHLTTAVQRAYGELRGRRERSAAQVLGEAAEQLDSAPHDVVAAALRRDATAQHLGDALVAGASTLYDWKVSALAKALANGLADNGAEIDHEGLVLHAIRDLEPPHVRTLLLMRHMPYAAGQLCRRLGLGEGTVSAVLATLERHALVESDALKQQEDRSRKIINELQAQRDAARLSSSDGVRWGTSGLRDAERSSVAWTATAFGRECLTYLEDFPQERAPGGSPAQGGDATGDS